jgi:hypothetical protein
VVYTEFSVLRKLRQEDGEFEDSLDYTARPCQKKKRKKEKERKDPSHDSKREQRHCGMRIHGTVRGWVKFRIA